MMTWAFASSVWAHIPLRQDRGSRRSLVGISTGGVDSRRRYRHAATARTLLPESQSARISPRGLSRMGPSRQLARRRLRARPHPERPRLRLPRPPPRAAGVARDRAGSSRPRQERMGRAAHRLRHAALPCRDGGGRLDRHVAGRPRRHGNGRAARRADPQTAAERLRRTRGGSGAAAHRRLHAHQAALREHRGARGAARRRADRETARSVE